MLLLNGKPEPVIDPATIPAGPATDGEKPVRVTNTVRLVSELVIAYPMPLTWTTGMPFPAGINEFPLESVAKLQLKLEVSPEAMLQATPKNVTVISERLKVTELGLLKLSEMLCPLS